MGWFFKKKNNPQDLNNLQRQKDKADKKIQEWIDNGDYVDCPECNGTGKIHHAFGGYKSAEICNNCSGKGRVWITHE
jgi:DnaJ-class molecular chaperone